MGRTKIELDKPLFLQIISDLEQDGPLANQNELFTKISENYISLQGKNYERMTAATARNRVLEWRVPIKTMPGKRGNPGLSGGIKRSPRRYTGDTIQKLDELRSYFKQTGYSNTRFKGSASHIRNIKLVDKIKKGSMKAAIKAKCLECAGFDKVEIKNCQCWNTCPLWAIRPYQSLDVKESCDATEEK